MLEQTIFPFVISNRKNGFKFRQVNNVRLQRLTCTPEIYNKTLTVAPATFHLTALLMVLVLLFITGF